MSTKLTTSTHGYALVDSASLQLFQSLAGFQDRLGLWLVARLRAEGFDELSPGQLSFLGSLDCGINYASALSRAHGVSRQAIHKQVRELERLRWLTTQAHPEKGNQRVIVFTAEGERMMSLARALFAELDTVLGATLGDIDKLAAGLEASLQSADNPTKDR